MALYIVQEGGLELQHQSNCDAIAGPGAIVGHVGLCPCNGIVFFQNTAMKATQPTTVLMLDRSDFCRILSEFPSERDVVISGLKGQWRKSVVCKNEECTLDS